MICVEQVTLLASRKSLMFLCIKLVTTPKMDEERAKTTKFRSLSTYEKDYHNYL